MGKPGTRTAQSRGLTPVNSNAITGVGFTMTDMARGLGTIRICYKRKPGSQPTLLSNTYDYYNVPEFVYLELIESKTPTSHITSSIKNRFAYKRFTEEELAKASQDRNPPPRPAPVDNSEFDAVFPQEDDLIAASNFPIKVAQGSLGPLSGDAPLIAMRNTVSSGKPFRFHGLTFVIREDTSQDGWFATVVRRLPGQEAPESHFSHRYVNKGNALNAMSRILTTNLRINNFSQDDNAMDQIGDHKAIVKGDKIYFLQHNQMFDLGDMAWVLARVQSGGDNREIDIEHEVAMGREELLHGIAFTDATQAESYLCSVQAYSDFGFADQTAIDESAEKTKNEPKRAPAYLVQPDEFDIDFVQDDDLIT